MNKKKLGKAIEIMLCEKSVRREDVGIKVVAISRHINGHAYPSVVSLEVYAKALGCSVSDIISKAESL